jgi:hypothetical protein
LSPDSNLERAKACVGDYFEELIVIRKTANGEDELINGVMYYFGPERDGSAWNVAYTLSRGPDMVMPRMIKQKCYKVTPEDLEVDSPPLFLTDFTSNELTA